MYHPRESVTALAGQYWGFGKYKAVTLAIAPESLKWRQLAPVGLLGLVALAAAPTRLAPAARTLLVGYAALVAVIAGRRMEAGAPPRYSRRSTSAGAPASSADSDGRSSAGFGRSGDGVRAARALLPRGLRPLADPLAVPARVLLEQVRRLLGRGLRPVDAAEILDRPAGSFHVTFDDAYRNIEQVLPELRSLGAGVTVFACSDLASDGAPLDVPELFRARWVTRRRS